MRYRDERQKQQKHIDTPVPSIILHCHTGVDLFSHFVVKCHISILFALINNKFDTRMWANFTILDLFTTHSGPILLQEGLITVISCNMSCKWGCPEYHFFRLRSFCSNQQWIFKAGLVCFIHACNPEGFAWTSHIYALFGTWQLFAHHG